MFPRIRKAIGVRKLFFELEQRKFQSVGVGERHNLGWSSMSLSIVGRCKGNVLCFGKSQQGVTFSCSRLK